MKRILICDPRPNTRTTLHQALSATAAEMGVQPIAFGQFSSIPQVVETLAGLRPGFCNLALCAIDGGPDDFEAAATLRRDHPDLALVLMSAAYDGALQAYALHADGFLPLPAASADFLRAVGPSLKKLATTRGATIALKSTKGVDVMDADRILYAETANGGPVIHLMGQEDVRVRGTLQGLFETLDYDKRFAKAGGSFIVNLDNVRSAGKSAVAFPDGSVVIVPIRARKPFQEALAAYRNR